MSDGFGLPDRMKRYEAVAEGTLTRRSPVIVRVDGKAFRSLTHGMERPFDAAFAACMDEAALALCEEAQGAKIAYVQSDEVSVLLTDYDTLTTEGWFGYRIQKIASVAASIATAAFGRAFRAAFPARVRSGLFDARAFTLPRDEVTNYFAWRQRDAVRNSILSVAQAHFSPRQMHGKNTDQLQEMLFREKGINWSDTPAYFKRGRCAYRSIYEKDGAVRHEWVIDPGTPEFTQDRQYIDRRMPA